VSFYSTILPRIPRFYFPQATLCPYRGTYQVPIHKGHQCKSDVHPKFPQIDLATTTTLAFPTPGGTSGTGPADGLTATLNVNFRLPARLGFLPRWPIVSVRVTGTRGTAELSNYLGPGYITTSRLRVQSRRAGGSGLRSVWESWVDDVSNRSCFLTHFLTF